MQTSYPAANIVAWYWPNLLDTEHTNHPFISVIQTVTERGCKVLVRKQPDQVVEAIAEQTPDLLLIHLQTSGDQGYQLCQALRQQPSTQHLPVVFVGNRGTSHEWISALRCGGNDYLQMPVEPEECWLRIEHHLSTAQLVRELQTTQLDLTEQIEKTNRALAQHEALKASLDRENQALQQLAFVDELTRVDNRRSFNQNIAKRWEEARERRQRISLLVCDIDYFKRYNDTYGHLAGDDCLRSVALALRQAVNRQQDQIARYGGEEFVILLPNTDAEGAQKVARDVQAAVDKARISHRDSLIKPFLSLSIGISTLRPSQLARCTYEELIRCADEALYNAKLQGRDRIFLNTAHPKQLAAAKVAKKAAERVTETWNDAVSSTEKAMREKVLYQTTHS
ncbi:MAG: diguanylate cyclase [Cyanobacteria bacterium P01_D01_bin.1]